MSSWALVPVKARSAGKQRLAQALSEPQRAALIRLMLGQALTALKSSAVISGIAVLTSGRDTLPQATVVLADSGAGLNDSLQQALPQLGARGATRITVLFADLPLITPADVSELFTAGESAGIALAPDHTGTGTNAVTLALPTPFRFQFGPGSFERHLAEAARSGSTAAVVRREGLAFDIDEPADLDMLRRRGERRFSFLS